MTTAALAPAAAQRPALTVARRIALVVAAALVLAVVHLPWRPRTLCLLRAFTGIPCPFCGGTTAMVHLGHGDIKGALGASPLALAMVASWPFLGVVRLPAWLQPRNVRWPFIGAILVGSEIFELFRFHIL